MSYTVEPDGSVSQISPSSDADPAFAGELTKVMMTSPRWKSPENKDANEPFTSEILIRFELPERVSNGIVYIMADEMPEFPGGDAALFKFFIWEQSNIRRSKSQRYSREGYPQIYYYI